MSDCAQCGRALGRALARCYRCGACESCCACDDGPDVEGFNADLSSFDRDELGLDPEEDDERRRSRRA